MVHPKYGCGQLVDKVDSTAACSGVFPIDIRLQTGKFFSFHPFTSDLK
jgi:hypothetical protein